MQRAGNGSSAGKSSSSGSEREWPPFEGRYGPLLEATAGARDPWWPVPKRPTRRTGR